MLVKFKQNRTVQTTRNSELFDKKKKKTFLSPNHFWQSVDAILEGVPVAEAIV